MDSGGGSQDHHGGHDGREGDRAGGRVPPSDLEHRVFRAMVRAADRLTGEFDALFREHGLTRTQYDVLFILDQAEQPLPAVSIARSLHTRDPDITRLLERLSTSGLVSRARSALDRRVTLNRLTGEGDEILATLKDPVHALHRRQFEHLATGELESLLALTDRTLDATD